MEVTYSFVNGENVIVSVGEELGKTIRQLDRDLYNNNHKETRRHQSLNEIKADTLIDKNVNIENDFLRRSDVDKLYNAISKLKPSEQELLHKLYLSKNPITQKQYAKMIGVTENAVKQKIKYLKNKLKKLLLS